MKKTIVLLLAVVLAVGSCCNRHRLESTDWTDFAPHNPSLTPEITALLDISVTVRTEAGDSISVFGRRIGTDGAQE